MTEDSKTIEISEKCFEEGYCVTRKAIDRIDEYDNLETVLKEIDRYEEITSITEEIVDAVQMHGFLPEINWSQFEIEKAKVENGDISTLYDSFMSALQKNVEPINVEVEVLKSSKPKMIRKDLVLSHDVIMKFKDRKDMRGEISHFSEYFNARYRKMTSLLLKRPEMKGVISIGNAQKKRNREESALIGMVKEIQTTKNEHVIFTIEDPTGEAKCFIYNSDQNRDLLEMSKHLILDEVVGVIVLTSPNKELHTCKEIIFPDVPITHNFPRVSEDVNAVFISDIHVGSNTYLEKDFIRFIRWLRGETGSKKHQELASKVGYLFIAGDSVDGIGIYKGQDKELTIPDLYKQYDRLAELLELLPENIVTVITPGNHDASREAEPQPPLPRDFCNRLYDKDRFVMTSNPSIVSVNTHDVPVSVLMYHGASIDSLIDAMPVIEDGYNKPHNVMKEMIQKRHIAPIYGSKHRIFPEKDDYLVIDTIPHIFHTGHVHTLGIEWYKKILLVNSGTFQGLTEFQKKLGHKPIPSQIPVLNFKTKDMTIMEFGNHNINNKGTIT